MAIPNSNALPSTAGGLRLPPHDYEVFTYVASGVADDDDIATVAGYVGGASGRLVGTLTFTYTGATNNVATAALTLPTPNG